MQDLVRGVEHGAEQLELLAQNLESQGLRQVVLGQEIDHRHAALLTVTMTAPYALLNALWVPRQIVVDDQRAELKVDSLGGSLSGDHDDRFITEILDQCSPHVSGLGTRYVVRAFVLLQPVLAP